MLSRRSLIISIPAGMIAAALPTPCALANAAPSRFVINLMFAGGADLRHLFVPDPARLPDYAAAFWKARAAMSAQDSAFATYQTVYANEYTPISLSGQTFGVHKAAGWLIDQLRAGKVAIVANVSGSDNRGHEHSQLIWRTGDPTVSPWDYDRDGWGGRLVYTLAGANAVTVSLRPSVFAQGIEPGVRNARAIHIPAPRNYALDESNSGPLSGLVAKSLSQYYAAKRQDAAAMPATWPFHRILATEEKLRTLGRALASRLAQAAPEVPDALQQLAEGPSGTRLTQTDFAKQCAALFDCAIAWDVLGMRAAYMEFGGWDTHLNQPGQLNTNFTDVFGAGKGLASLHGELTKRGLADAYVIVITSEFGRQIVANTRGGTDHGRGNYAIVIGERVRGGVFGEMFPAREIAGPVGARPFDVPGSDILGLTSFERVLGEVCDWVAPGSGDQVFPGRRSAILEPGVDLSRLFV
jgi:uncharacterized protein (DUF1501 family)